jgi:hypothetical protein
MSIVTIFPLSAGWAGSLRSYLHGNWWMEELNLYAKVYMMGSGFQSAIGKLVGKDRSMDVHLQHTSTNILILRHASTPSSCRGLTVLFNNLGRKEGPLLQITLYSFIGGFGKSQHQCKWFTIWSNFVL